MHINNIWNVVNYAALQSKCRGVTVINDRWHLSVTWHHLTLQWLIKVKSREWEVRQSSVNRQIRSLVLILCPDLMSLLLLCTQTAAQGENSDNSCESSSSKWFHLPLKSQRLPTSSAALAHSLRASAPAFSSGIVLVRLLFILLHSFISLSIEVFISNGQFSDLS